MKNIFWNQLLSLSDDLKTSPNLKIDNIQTLISQLESICIAHEGAFEPADEFEEYVTLNLCRAIAQRLKNQ